MAARLRRLSNFMLPCGRALRKTQKKENTYDENERDRTINGESGSVSRRTAPCQPRIKKFLGHIPPSNLIELDECR